MNGPDRQQPPQAQQFPCGECGSAFNSHKALRCHETIHTVSRPYVCNDCGATFRQKGHLDRHKSVHTDGRPFQCLDCGAAFRYVAHLRRHKFIHTGQRPFKCEICGHAFGRKDHLQKHMTIHTGPPGNGNGNHQLHPPNAKRTRKSKKNNQQQQQQQLPPPQPPNEPPDLVNHHGVIDHPHHVPHPVSPYPNGHSEEFKNNDGPHLSSRPYGNPAEVGGGVVPVSEGDHVHHPHLSQHPIPHHPHPHTVATLEPIQHSDRGGPTGDYGGGELKYIPAIHPHLVDPSAPSNNRDAEFRSPSNITTVTNGGGVNSNYRCSKCNVIFFDPESLDSHVQSTECRNCGVLFSHSCELENHKCGLSRVDAPTAVDNNNASTTIKSESSSTTRCHSCGIVMSYSEYKTHVCSNRMHEQGNGDSNNSVNSHPPQPPHAGGGVQCSNCCAVFQDESALQYHHCVIHPVQCKECGMVFANTSALSYHVCIKPMSMPPPMPPPMSMSTWSPPYQCRMCGVMLPNAYAIDQHVCMRHLHQQPPMLHPDSLAPTSTPPVIPSVVKGEYHYNHHQQHHHEERRESTETKSMYDNHHNHHRRVIKNELITYDDPNTTNNNNNNNDHHRNNRLNLLRQESPDSSTPSITLMDNANESSSSTQETNNKSSPSSSTTTGPDTTTVSTTTPTSTTINNNNSPSTTNVPVSTAIKTVVRDGERDFAMSSAQTLLQTIFDEHALRGFGWPEISLECLLERVIQYHNYSTLSAELEKGTSIWWKENLKILIQIIVGPDAVRTIIDAKTFEDGMQTVLNQVKRKIC